MEPEKIKAIEVRIDLSKQIFGAAITLMGFQSALLLFVLEKKEGVWYFYLPSFIAFACLILSLVFSGHGIDDQTAKLESKQVKSKVDPLDLQVLFAYLGIFFFILSVAAAVFMPGKAKEKGDNKCCVVVEKNCPDTDVKMPKGLVLIGNIGPFISGSNAIQNPNARQFQIVMDSISKNNYSEIFIFGGVDKRPLKQTASKVFGDNLTLAQARANIVMDSIENYLINLQFKIRPMIFIYTNGGQYYGNDPQKLENDRHVKIYGRKANASIN